MLKLSLRASGRDLQNFNPINLRNDVGQLWENYLVIERRKANQTAGRMANTYFWHTYDQKEIDLIEEHRGKLHGYEFKWQSSRLRRATKEEFLNAYPGSELAVVNPKISRLFFRTRRYIRAA